MRLSSVLDWMGVSAAYEVFETSNWFKIVEALITQHWDGHLVDVVVVTLAELTWQVAQIDTDQDRGLHNAGNDAM
jgi:hypothetical protein